MRFTIVLVGFVVTGCEAFAVHEGRVSDCATGRPIGSAVVQLRSPLVKDGGNVAATKPDGSYAVLVPQGAPVHQLATAAGYRQDERDLARRDQGDDVPTNVCLQK